MQKQLPRRESGSTRAWNCYSRAGGKPVKYEDVPQASLISHLRGNDDGGGRLIKG